MYSVSKHTHPYLRTVYILLVVFIALVGFNACSGSKKVTSTTTGKKVKKRSANYLEDKLAKNVIQPEYFKAKVKVHASDISNSQSFNAEIRLKKDSLIWMSVYPNFGIKIEVARALITRDTVKVIDRFNKEYYIKDIGYIETLLNYPLDFEALQNMILGNRLIDDSEDKKKVEMTDMGYCLNSNRDELDISVCIEPDNHNITQLAVVDNLNYRTLNIDLVDYKEVEKNNFSHKRFITALTPSKYEAELKFSKIKFDETLNFPFSVSSKYKVIR